MEVSVSFVSRSPRRRLGSRRLAGLLSLGLAAAGWAREAPPSRDWQRHPAVLELVDVARVVAVSDVHGALPQLEATLRAVDLVADREGAQGCRWRWTGGESVLIFTGDYGDRGAYTREVYDLLACLGPRARAAGGRVVPLLGNHETMLLSGEVARRAVRASPGRREGYQATVESLTRGGRTLAEVVGPRGDVGRALRRMPVAAVVNDQVAFMHGGLGVPRTRAQLAASLRRVVDGERWRDPFVSPTSAATLAASPVWARDWWDDQEHVDALLGALGVERLVFGHSYAGLSERLGVGEAGWGRVLSDGRLFKIDVGMCPAYGFSQGGALEIRFRDEAPPVYRAVYPDRPAERFP